MAFLTKGLGVLMILSGIAAMALLMVTPLFHDESPDYPAWRALNYVMAVMVVVSLVIAGKKNTQQILPRNHLRRIQIAFDDHRLVNNAGLILPTTLAQQPDLPQLVDRRLDLDRVPGRANVGDKVMTLVASALAGGDCIAAAAALHTGRTSAALGCTVKAPSTPAFARAGSGHLPVGTLPPTGPGEPRGAGTGLGGWRRPWR